MTLQLAADIKPGDHIQHIGTNRWHYVRHIQPGLGDDMIVFHTRIGGHEEHIDAYLDDAFKVRPGEQGPPTVKTLKVETVVNAALTHLAKVDAVAVATFFNSLDAGDEFTDALIWAYADEPRGEDQGTTTKAAPGLSPAPTQADSPNQPRKDDPAGTHPVSSHAFTDSNPAA